MTTQTSIQPFHVVPGAAVKNILNGLRQDAIELVAQTYLTHERGETVNPDSYFLRFPEQPANRIIALPAAIVDSEGDQSVSGIKWIASYPDNIKSGIPRASAVLILNDPDTGYPYALLEGALISAVRTAASAVLGAWWLNGQNKRAPRLSIVGGGVIARNILETFIS
ncbi:2,3-diaminopropionate biosynthesis protein SbnB, partial [Pseudomonas sp. HMWF007]